MEEPHYQRIRDDLEEQIRSGSYPPGSKLPTEAQLQEKYKVSRSVAQRALNELASAGLVTRQKAKGTHVTHGPPQINLLRAIDPTLGSAGLPGTMSVISAEVKPASHAEVKIPDIEDDAPVNQLIRARYHKRDTPMSIEISVVPFSVSPTMLQEDLRDMLVRSHLKSVGISLARSRMYIDAIPIPQPYSGLLDLEDKTPILRRRRHMWQANGKIAEIAIMYMQPREISFYVEHSE